MQVVLDLLKSKKAKAALAAVLVGVAGYVTGTETILQVVQSVFSAVTGG